MVKNLRRIHGGTAEFRMWPWMDDYPFSCMQIYFYLYLIIVVQYKLLNNEKINSTRSFIFSHTKSSLSTNCESLKTSSRGHE